MKFANDPPMTTEERQAWFIERTTPPNEGYGAWSGDVLVGTVGLHDRIGPRAREIGYWVHADHLGRGVATAMVRQICAIAFAQEDVDHLEIHHDRANVASGRVARAAGFTYVFDRPNPPWGPADEGVESVWRLERDAG